MRGEHRNIVRGQGAAWLISFLEGHDLVPLFDKLADTLDYYFPTEELVVRQGPYGTNYIEVLIFPNATEWGKGHGPLERRLRKQFVAFLSGWWGPTVTIFKPPIRVILRQHPSNKKEQIVGTVGTKGKKLGLTTGVGRSLAGDYLK